MLNLTDYKLVRGVNPNLAAGQRSMRVPAEYSQYSICEIPNNAQYYNFGDGPFTIFIRYLDLGADRAYDQTILVAKNVSGTGWDISKQNSVGNLTFRTKAGGAVRSSVQDRRPAPVDGFFHSVCITKGIAPTGVDSSDVSLIRMFIDGVELSGNNRNAGGSTAISFDSNDSVQIGGYSGYYPRGYIDACAFYTTGLTDQEISLLGSSNSPDRGAKFIQNFNQLSGTIAYDSSSVGQNGTISFNALDAAGRGWVLNDGIRTFRRASTFQAPLNGDFTPTVRSRVTGIARFDTDLTDAQYSLDGVQWITLTFDSNNLTVGLPPLDINPAGINPILYLRASNANPSYLNALEIQY
ncbi:hypothetical protein QMK33_00240 [Hymenobacter sp. H14-R3]|uniref:LamG-like jellyroll fold domain-containing protein n=1 Tax=Hymenobacter sp. H14-R3 TaxID=3046308 RepID=UPI0024BA1083|nr:LamG-like jellyroll fold domain-containing protein [Hymenobacter sp. H14-R3]MDJ0363562.1 hypothetical protein [Hymenobacter sp. H14-R3]